MSGALTGGSGVASGGASGGSPADSPAHTPAHAPDHTPAHIPAHIPARALAFSLLRVQRMPGVPRGSGFEIRGLGPGINVIFGPNGIGKSTTARAIEELMWPGSLAIARRGAVSELDPKLVPKPNPELSAQVLIDGAAWSAELEGGQCTWRHDGATAPAPDLGSPELRHRYRLALAELLTSVADDDRFASALARAAAGGFDLEAIRRQVDAGGRPAGRRAAQQALREASDRLRAARALADTLDRRRTDELPALCARRDAVRSLAGRADAIAAALRRLDAADELAAASAALALLPVRQLRACHVDDDAAQRALAARRSALEREAEGHRARLADVERQLERQTFARVSAGDSAVPVSPTGLATEDADILEELAAQLEELERSRLATTQLLEGVRARRDEGALRPLTAGRQVEPRAAAARSAPGSGTRGPDSENALATALSAVRVDADASTLARESHQLAARRAALEAMRRVLPPVAELQSRAAAVSTLEQLRRDLSDWLAATPPRAATSPPWLAVAGLALAAVLAVMLAILHAVGWLLFLLPLGVLAFVLTRPPGDPLGAERESMRQRVERSAARGPREWSTDAVAARLRELDAESAAAAAAQRDLAAHRTLDQDAATLAEAETQHRLALATVEQRFGMPLPADPGWLPLLATALADWQRAQREVVDVSARLKELERQLGELHRRAAPMVAHLSAASRSVPDAASAGAVADRSRPDAPSELPTPATLRALARAMRAHLQTREQAAELRRELSTRIVPQLAAASAEQVRFFETRGLAPRDDASLRALLSALPRLRQAEDRLAAATSADAASERALAALLAGLDGPPPPLSDRAALEDERQRSAEALAERDAVITTIATIEAQLAEAAAGHDVGEALAAFEEAKGRLTAIRDQETRSAIAELLLQRIEEGSRAASEPEVLRLAKGLLARLTQGRFSLRLVTANGRPSFAVHDSQAAIEKSIDQLSAGERVQMLCAVRIAFLEHDERRALPLLVDETLGTCDDERAAALMDALIAIADTGRQVIYFTAQRDEAAKWKARIALHARVPFALVDLGAIRLGEHARMAPLPIEPLPPSPIPAPPVDAPGDRYHELYGATLGVPGLDPFHQQPEQVHLWHAVDEPAAIHALLRHGFSTLGQLLEYRSAVGAPPPGATEQICREAEAKGQALAVLFDRWRVGRARPATLEDVLATGAVSTRFEPALRTLLAEVHGDASKLLEALDGGALPGWRRSKSDELRDGLRAQGLLAEGAVMNRSALELELRIALHQAIAEGVVAPEWPQRAVSRIVERWSVPGMGDDRSEVAANDFVGGHPE